MKHFNSIRLGFIVQYIDLIRETSDKSDCENFIPSFHDATLYDKSHIQKCDRHMKVPVAYIDCLKRGSVKKVENIQNIYNTDSTYFTHHE